MMYGPCEPLETATCKIVYRCKFPGRWLNITVTPDLVSVWYVIPLAWSSITWADTHCDSHTVPSPTAPRSRFMRPYYDK